MCSTHRGQERVSDSLGLDSQMAVRCCVSVLGIELGFYKECSLTPKLFPQPRHYLFFETRFHCIVQTGLELTLLSRLVSNSWQSS